MKFLILSLFFSSMSFAAPVKKDVKVKPAPKAAMKNKALEIIKGKEEECDDKAKKEVEIKPESISLTGNAGCSLDQAH